MSNAFTKQSDQIMTDSNHKGSTILFQVKGLVKEVTIKSKLSFMSHNYPNEYSLGWG